MANTRPLEDVLTEQFFQAVNSGNLEKVQELTTLNRQLKTFKADNYTTHLRTAIALAAWKAGGHNTPQSRRDIVYWLFKQALSSGTSNPFDRLQLSVVVFHVTQWEMDDKSEIKKAAQLIQGCFNLGAKRNKTVEDGTQNTVVHNIIKKQNSNYLPLLKVLLKYLPPNILEAKNKDGNLYLHLLASAQFPHCIPLLEELMPHITLSHLDTKNKEGKNPYELIAPNHLQFRQLFQKRHNVLQASGASFHFICPMNPQLLRQQIDECFSRTNSSEILRELKKIMTSDSIKIEIDARDKDQAYKDISCLRYIMYFLLVNKEENIKELVTSIWQHALSLLVHNNDDELQLGNILLDLLYFKVNSFTPQIYDEFITDFFAKGCLIENSCNYSDGKNLFHILITQHAFSTFSKLIGYIDKGKIDPTLLNQKTLKELQLPLHLLAMKKNSTSDDECTLRALLKYTTADQLQERDLNRKTTMDYVHENQNESFKTLIDEHAIALQNQEFWNKQIRQLICEYEKKHKVNIPVHSMIGNLLVMVGARAETATVLIDVLQFIVNDYTLWPEKQEQECAKEIKRYLTTTPDSNKYLKEPPTVIGLMLKHQIIAQRNSTISSMSTSTSSVTTPTSTTIPTSDMLLQMSPSPVTDKFALTSDTTSNNSQNSASSSSDASSGVKFNGASYKTVMIDGTTEEFEYIDPDTQKTVMTYIGQDPLSARYEVSMRKKF